MDVNRKKILIVGAGAVGGTTAGLLSRDGFDVTLVCKYPDVAAKIRNEGLHLSGLGKNLVIKVPAVATVDEINNYFDLVLLATKAMDMATAARGCLPHLNPESKVVAMQNGIMEPQLEKIVGKERTIGCVVGFGATMLGYGEIELTSHGEMWLGYTDRPADDTMLEISRIFSHVTVAHTVDSILPIRYAKLIINSCTSTLGVITGMELGPLLKIRKARKLFLRVGKEAVHVADAMGLQVPPYDGSIRFRTILKAPAPVQHLAIRIIGIRYKKLKSTNLQSIERGGITEIEFLNGYIVKRGESLNVRTPVNRKLLEMVREIEQKIRPVSPRNLEEKELWN
jgi:2-dehydropantoate 2-reductase